MIIMHFLLSDTITIILALFLIFQRMLRPQLLLLRQQLQILQKQQMSHTTATLGGKGGKIDFINYADCIFYFFRSVRIIILRDKCLKYFWYFQAISFLLVHLNGAYAFMMTFHS